jgi:O-antigen/teichoic acid export membrane protein
MGKFRKLAGETALYGLSSIIGKAINFVLVPFYTSAAILQVEEYGIVTELYSYVAVLNVLYLYGMETAYFRFTSKAGADEKAIFNSVFTSILITTFALSALLISAATPIVNWLEFPGQERFVYWLAAIIAIDSIMAIPFVKLALRRKSQTICDLQTDQHFSECGLEFIFPVLLQKCLGGQLFCLIIKN